MEKIIHPLVMPMIVEEQIPFTVIRGYKDVTDWVVVDMDEGMCKENLMVSEGHRERLAKIVNLITRQSA